MGVTKPTDIAFGGPILYVYSAPQKIPNSPVRRFRRLCQGLLPRLAPRGSSPGSTNGGIEGFKQREYTSKATYFLRHIVKSCDLTNKTRDGIRKNRIALTRIVILLQKLSLNALKCDLLDKRGDFADPYLTQSGIPSHDHHTMVTEI